MNVEMPSTLRPNAAVLFENGLSPILIKEQSVFKLIMFIEDELCFKFQI